jgi:dTDP-4-dehydrorhamnose reductase
MKNILITGGSSLLAFNWIIARRKINKIYILLNTRIVSIPNTIGIECNLDNIENIREIIKKYNIECCIHTAGLTDVEICEQRPNLAYYINVKLSKNVATACSKEKIKLVHISTDHLHNGCKNFLDENKKLEPQNIYGKTKAKAETMVSENYPSSLIIRSNFFGYSPIYKKSFSDRILNSCVKKQEILLFSDVYFCPILATNLANISHKLIEKKAKGIFNIVSHERVSKYEFGLMLIKTFNLDIKFIKKGFFNDIKGLTVRPMDMSLSNKKLCDFIGHDIQTLKQQLSEYKNEHTILAEK